MSDNKCVFCLDNWPNLEILADIVNIQGHRNAVLRPLEPVTDGHVLVIGALHTTTAASEPKLTGELMVTAAWWVQKLQIEANIITSIGAAATQTVMHTHLHVVPRKPGDNLPLPWTPQHEVKSLEQAVVLRRALQESGGSNDSASQGLFQQRPVSWGQGSQNLNLCPQCRRPKDDKKAGRCCICVASDGETENRWLGDSAADSIVKGPW